MSKTFKRVILCRSLQLVAKRQQRGNPTLIGHSRDRLSFRGGRVASQNLQSSSGQAREIDATRAERTHFDESVQRIHQGWRACAHRRRP
jgi:hypothetical protein